MTEFDSTALRATPLTPTIGVVVEGVDLSSGSPTDVFDVLSSQLNQHHVVVVPGQHLSPERLRDLVAAFGPLFLHHDAEFVLPVDGVPEVLRMLKEADGTRLFGGADWHADVTFRNPGGYVSMLHALELPPLGGDTLFASTVAAFAALSPGMQRMLRPLRAVHSYDGPTAPDHPHESATHPVVRTHPVSGREGLYLNRMFVRRFDGMTERESRPLIEFFDRHMSRPEFCCRVRWSEGQVVLWDNRFSLHYPSNDFSGYRRHLIRCTAMEA